MITLQEIHLINFLSFKDQKFVFPQHPLNVQGVNKTDDDQESNGSGKSGFFTAVEFCTMGTNSRKERDVNLIRRGASSAEVIETWHCDVRKETLMIHRVIKKKGTKLDILINGEPAPFSTVRDGNEFILRWLGTSKEDLTSYYIIGQERFKSFFSSSNKEKLELIGRLAGTSYLDEVDDLIKSDVKDIEKEISALNEKKFELVGEKRSYENQIEKLLVSDDDSQDDLIKAIKSDISDLNTDMSSLNEKIGRLEKLIVDLNKELTAAKKKAEKLVEVDVKLYESELSSLRKQKVEVNSIKADAENKLAGEIVCPKCDHNFSLSEGVDLETQKEIVEDCGLLIESLIDEIDETTKKLNEAEDVNKKVRLAKLEVQSKENAILDANNDIKATLSRIALKKDEVALKEAKIVQIQSAAPTDNTELIEGLRKDVERCDDLIVEKEAEIQVKQDECFETEQWITNFKRFKMNLANKTLQSIQSQCNVNLSKMKSDLSVFIDGFKINADGKQKEEITPYVIRDQMTSFFSYSGGEKGRVQFAMILAIQELINRQNPYGGINLLMVDEIFEGLDSLGLRHLMKSIKNLALNAMIITHVATDRAADNNLVIEKVCGISKIVE